MGIRVFTDNELMEISKILGDTSSGFTGSEIGTLLQSCGFPDPGPITKRDRLLLGLQGGQAQDGSGTKVAKLVERAMDPVRYRGERGMFEDRRHDLNVILAFAGMRIREDGKLEFIPAAATLSEAERRASKLRSELARRGIAGDVLRFCRPELLEDNYFHAVFEATKSVAQKIRDRTGLALDGHALVEEALGIKNNRTPMLAWNRLATENDTSEHRGVALMIAGTLFLLQEPSRACAQDRISKRDRRGGTRASHHRVLPSPAPGRCCPNHSESHQLRVVTRSACVSPQVMAHDALPHTRASANRLIYQPWASRGRQSALCVLLYYGTVIVHTFVPEERKYHGLERLWSKATQVVRIV